MIKKQGCAPQTSWKLKLLTGICGFSWVNWSWIRVGLLIKPCMKWHTSEVRWPCFFKHVLVCNVLLLRSWKGQASLRPRDPKHHQRLLQVRVARKANPKGNPRAVWNGWGAMVDGQKKQLCMRYQNGSCTFTDCKFHHGCAYPKPDGSACGLPHPAMQHASTPHWLELAPEPSVAIIISDDEDNSVSQVSKFDTVPQGNPLHCMTETKEVSTAVQPPVSHQPADNGREPQSSPVAPVAPTHNMASKSSAQSAAPYPSRLSLDICSGSTRPLSSAVMKLGGDVCSIIDILVCTEYDLLNDEFYLDLLRLAASGRIGYFACSPSCNEYSVLKLKPGVLQLCNHMNFWMASQIWMRSIFPKFKAAILCFPDVQKFFKWSTQQGVTDTWSSLHQPWAGWRPVLAAG